MANKQLEGRVFNHEGRNYLVMEDNDWEADTLKVKSVDAMREVSKFPLNLILSRVGSRQERRG